MLKQGSLVLLLSRVSYGYDSIFRKLTISAKYVGTGRIPVRNSLLEYFAEPDEMNVGITINYDK